MEQFAPDIGVDMLHTVGQLNQIHNISIILSGAVRR
jgi:hypothetical protein